MDRRRADDEPGGCRHLARKAGSAGGSEEIGDGVGAGTGSEVDGVEIGVDAGIRRGDGSEDVRSAGLGAEAGSSAKPA